VIGDYHVLMTPQFLQELLAVNAARNAAGPFVLALAFDGDRGVAICELQSVSRVVKNARFEQRRGEAAWVAVSDAPPSLVRS
jgi:hypothetical protein